MRVFPSLVITPSFGQHHARAAFDGRAMQARIGKGGLRGIKKEGDGCSPRGCYAMEYGLYRPDRMTRPATRLPMVALAPHMGWCDDPFHQAYNTAVTLPFAGRHEKMWREDSLYDLVIVLSHNRQPAMKGKGSAIFLHCMAEDGRATQGCAAFPKEQFLAFLRRFEAGTRVCFGVVEQA